MRISDWSSDVCSSELSVAVAAVMPGPVLFGVVLFFVGLAALIFMTASNSMMQLTTERTMRGRVLALRIAVVMGGTPLGAPLVGWRSEEHTSELQSLMRISYAVFCLKKKNKTTKQNTKVKSAKHIRI